MAKTNAPSHGVQYSRSPSGARGLGREGPGGGWMVRLCSDEWRKGKHRTLTNRELHGKFRTAELSGATQNLELSEAQRHSDIRTTLNVYGNVVTDEMAQANSKVARMALSRTN
jgi:hypothetical protein